MSDPDVIGMLACLAAGHWPPNAKWNRSCIRRTLIDCSKGPCTHLRSEAQFRWQLSRPSGCLFVPDLIELKELLNACIKLNVSLIGKYRLIGFDRRQEEKRNRLENGEQPVGRRQTVESGTVTSRRCSERQCFRFGAMLPCRSSTLAAACTTCRSLDTDN